MKAPRNWRPVLAEAAVSARRASARAVARFPITINSPASLVSMAQAGPENHSGKTGTRSYFNHIFTVNTSDRYDKRTSASIGSVWETAYSWSTGRLAR